MGTQRERQGSSEDKEHQVVHTEEEEQQQQDDGVVEARDKKWQYSDPLQVCISTYCNGRRHNKFYECVFDRCVARKERNEEEEREKRRRRRW